jgi:thiamine-phosphate pyrophosphorylase
MNQPEWRTYLVTQASRSAGRDTEAVVEAALAGGVDAVQLREKGASDAERYAVGRRVRELTAEAGVPLIVNDRIDIAAAIDADGVHLGQSDLPVAVAREQLGAEAVVGRSTSTVAEARAAAEAGADYLGVGAVYGTESKEVPDAKDGIGTERVREIAAAVDVPVIGIGGIDAGNAGEVAAAGAAGVAVVSGIAAAEAGADYLGVGAVDGTESKEVADAKDGIGTERVREIAAAVDVPVIGIGGIDADNAGAVAAAGAGGVAVVWGIRAAGDPAGATAAIREAVVSEAAAVE